MAKQSTPTPTPGDDTGHPSVKLDAAECMEVLGSWHLSMMSFCMKRAQAYWALPGIAPELLTANDWMAAHERFLKTTVTDYAEQADTLRRLMPRDPTGADGDSQPGYEQGLLKAQADAAQIIDQAKRQAERIVADAEKRAQAASGDQGKAGGRQALKKSA